jgi:hypothetical protein
MHFPGGDTGVLSGLSITRPEMDIHQVWLVWEPVDMRAGIDRLSGWGVSWLNAKSWTQLTQCPDYKYQGDTSFLCAHLKPKYLLESPNGRVTSVSALSLGFIEPPNP